MKRILVIGGTKFFGIHTVNALIDQGYDVTVATRGSRNKPFGDNVKYITVDHTDPENMKQALSGTSFDVVIDKIAYCSNDIKYALDVLNCGKYIQMSSTAVYSPKHINTVEDDYNPKAQKLIWCTRADFPYDEVKRQAENALFQVYENQKAIAVRCPFVVGKDDYTKRLRFYVEHTIKGIPMFIDNIDCQMGYIDSREAGEFLAFLVSSDFSGAVNACSHGTVSLKEIIGYVEKTTGTKAVLSDDGDNAPYNGEVEYSINTDLAESLGYKFSSLKDWIYDLLDYYILTIQSEIIQ